MRCVGAHRQERALCELQQSRQKAQHWDNILTPMQAADGTTSGILCVSRDVTLQKEAERRLRIASDTDDLTGLPNRRAFKSKVRQLIRHCREEKRQFGLLLIDLDHFKQVNDPLGHTAGDHLLLVLANLLTASAAGPARLGGDEFAHRRQRRDRPGRPAARGRTGARADQRADSLRQQGDQRRHEHRHLAFPRRQDAAGLLKCSDTALNDIRAAGRGGVRMFSSDMHEAAEAAALQVAQAHLIVRDDLIVPHYQPKVNLHTGETVGFEALAALERPRAGPASVLFLKPSRTTNSPPASATPCRPRCSPTWHAGSSKASPCCASLTRQAVEFLRDDFAERFLKRLARHRIPHQAAHRAGNHRIRAQANAARIRRPRAAPC